MGTPWDGHGSFGIRSGASRQSGDELGGMLRDNHLMSWCDRAPVAALLALALLAPGCSAAAASGGPATPRRRMPPPRRRRRAPPIAEPRQDLELLLRLLGEIAAAGGQRAPDVDCPYIDIRQGASTLTIPPPPPEGGNEAMSLKYQGTFVRAARECAVVAGQMVMKVGVEGRIIVGPAGGPGQVDVPLRIAVVKRPTAGSKTIVTKLIRIPVTVAVRRRTTRPSPISKKDLSFPDAAGCRRSTITSSISASIQLAADAQDKDKAKADSAPKAKPKPKPKPDPPATANPRPLTDRTSQSTSRANR